MLNVAIIGFGLSGRYLQAPFIVANPNYCLKTIVTSNSLVKEIYPNVTQQSTLEEVLADDTIDLVSIASPNATHFEYAKRTLLAGKHVLVEKPIASTAAEVEELIELAKKQGKVLAVFQNRRFDSDFMTVQKVLKNDFLGELVSFEAHFDRHKPALNPKKWKEEIAPASGLIYDLGPHLIDQVVALFGEPKQVWGQTYCEREGSQIDDAFDIFLDYGRLKVRLKASLLVREEGPRYMLHGTKGSFVKYGIDVQEDHLKAGMQPKDAGFGVEPRKQWGILNTEIGGCHIDGRIETETGNWGILFQNLFEAITENQPLLISLEEVLIQMRIIELVTKA